MAKIDPIPVLAVRPRDASRMIGIGRTKLYELIKSGELDTVKVGRATLITVRSLRYLIGQ
jgi:excisionase family DNA binding protein